MTMDRIVGWRGRGGSRAVTVLTLVAVFTAWAGPAGATVHTNTGSIAIPSTGSDGRATPYPSDITLAESGTITDVNVTFTGLTHVYPSDLDTLLVSPGGQSVVLMADAGGNTPITALNLAFDDAATTGSLPVSAPITAGGTFKPTSGSAFNGTAPAPAGPYGTTLSVFNGTEQSGTWHLYAFDDFSTNGGGTITGGWGLDITTLAITSFDPTGVVGDVVAITGSGFTGATAVTFGPTPVTTFSVDSDTRITATVPAGASTGPISVAIPTGNVTSASDFVVQHAREVSLTLTRKNGKGTVDATDGFTACTANVTVKVQHLKKHKWRMVAGDLTGSDGAYTVIGLKDRGKYRAVAKGLTSSTGDVCLKAISPVVKK